ncbi:GerAB/ArcD/ProY family transporter [Paenibacillus sp. USDA918EY]|uniref:GerAB/ArcD/ProY family transporter n=1 Tax=Paenibacillus sp. USDA918EY TaxID=2689575 RepID=UPI001358F442|nr:endospore germination permease [Paenibacillus sp. USDA918EY]
MQKITARQVVLIGMIYVINTTLLNVPSQLITRASQHAFICYLLSAVLVLLMLYLLTRSSQRFPEQNLFESLKSRFPAVGRVILSLYILFFFMVLVRDIRIISDFTNVVLLPLTPILISSLCITATVIYIARGGARIVLGITELYGPIIIIVFALMPLIALRDFDLGLMRPLLHVNWAKVAEGSWISVSYIGQMLILPFIFSSKDYKFKHGVYSMLITMAILMGVIIMVILLLGVEVSERMMYPTYELVRQLRITDFLDRFDLIVVAIWFPSVLLNLAISLYIICYGMKLVIPSVSGKMMAAPIGLFAFSCAFWFYSNSIELFNFNEEWTLIALFFILVLPLLIFLIHRPAKNADRKGHSGNVALEKGTRK